MINSTFTIPYFYKNDSPFVTIVNSDYSEKLIREEFIIEVVDHGYRESKPVIYIKTLSMSSGHSLNRLNQGIFYSDQT